METSSLRNLKIMARNLNEIVRSWIRLQFSRTAEYFDNKIYLVLVSTPPFCAEKYAHRYLYSY
jgi:hypothetical protein